MPRLCTHSHSHTGSEWQDFRLAENQFRAFRMRLVVHEKLRKVSACDAASPVPTQPDSLKEEEVCRIHFAEQTKPDVFCSESSSRRRTKIKYSVSQFFVFRKLYSDDGQKPIDISFAHRSTYSLLDSHKLFSAALLARHHMLAADRFVTRKLMPPFMTNVTENGSHSSGALSNASKS